MVDFSLYRRNVNVQETNENLLQLNTESELGYRLCYHTANTNLKKKWESDGSVNVTTAQEGQQALAHCCEYALAQICVSGSCSVKTIQI